MLSMFGWVVLVIFAIIITVIWVMALVDGCGEYNVHGIRNTWKDRIYMIIFFVIVIFMWRWVSDIAPFTLFL